MELFDITERILDKIQNEQKYSHFYEYEIEDSDCIYVFKGYYIWEGANFEIHSSYIQFPDFQAEIKKEYLTEIENMVSDELKN